MKHIGFSKVWKTFSALFQRFENKKNRSEERAFRMVHLSGWRYEPILSHLHPTRFPRWMAKRKQESHPNHLYFNNLKNKPSLTKEIAAYIGLATVPSNKVSILNGNVKLCGDHGFTEHFYIGHIIIHYNEFMLFYKLTK
jgi:hypothetical protein